MMIKRNPMGHCGNPWDSVFSSWDGRTRHDGLAAHRGAFHFIGRAASHGRGKFVVLDWFEAHPKSGYLKAALRGALRSKAARLVVAKIAEWAGHFVGRPQSGKWLAHYFRGTGTELPMPQSVLDSVAEAIRELRHWGYYPGTVFLHRLGDDDEPAETRYVSRGECWLELRTGEPPGCSDDFTTVGSVLVHAVGGAREQEEFLRATKFEVIDVYDWHAGSSWDFKFSVGPVNVVVSGVDEFWTDLGRPFVTRGLVEVPDEVS